MHKKLYSILILEHLLRTAKDQSKKQHFKVPAPESVTAASCLSLARLKHQVQTQHVLFSRKQHRTQGAQDSSTRGQTFRDIGVPILGESIYPLHPGID